MKKSVQLTATVLFFTIASGIGLLTVLMFMFHPPATVSDAMLRRPLIGSIFLLICIFGGISALFPKECSRILGSQKERGSVAFHTAPLTEHRIEGHHPDCGEFSAHTIRMHERVMCAACTGLFLGAVIGVLGAVVYFFIGLDVEQFSFPLVGVGVGLVAIGFAQFKFRSLIRLLLNALFVLGAFCILIGLDAFTRNLLVDFYIISLIILWILTRIFLSEWDHSRICRSCTSECKVQKEAGI
jgi:hypothetical protein